MTKGDLSIVHYIYSYDVMQLILYFLHMQNSGHITALPYFLFENVLLQNTPLYIPGKIVITSYKLCQIINNHMRINFNMP
jgi:hypothetical protein